MSRKIFCRTSILAFLFSLFVLQTAIAGNIEVTGAWVREAPPTSRVLAGYMNIKNNTNNAIKLIAVSSDISKRTEMHNTVIENNMARMVELKQLSIASQKQTAFKPGGQHLMLMGISKPVRAGDVVTLQLKFENGVEKTVKADVRKVTGADPHAHHHH